jgi:DNA-binding MarR family transcriptional regulator
VCETTNKDLLLSANTQLALGYLFGSFFYAQKMKEQNEELGMFVLFPTHYLEHMTPRQAVLMGMLIGMAKRSGYAYPSNKTISTILNMTTITVQRELAILEEKGFLTRQLIRDNNNQVVSRKIYPHIKTDTTLISNVILPSSQDCNSNKDNNKNIDDKDNQTFETYWNLYKKKGNKQTATTAFAKLKDAEKELLLSFIPKYIKNHEDADKMNFLPHFTTFLNQKRWNDELPYSPTKQIEVRIHKPRIATL